MPILSRLISTSIKGNYRPMQTLAASIVPRNFNGLPTNRILYNGRGAWLRSTARSRRWQGVAYSVHLRALYTTTCTPAAAFDDGIAGSSVNNGEDDYLSLGRRWTGSSVSLDIPQRMKHKVVSASDAVSLVSNGDTICVSGFVCQGSPEAILSALGRRYEESGDPHSLTLLFGGGPGDWDAKGLNHLAKGADETGDSAHEYPMLLRTIGAHYGQVPRVGSLALSNDVEAWTLPLGSISRMIRSQSTHSPGYITTVGLGTFVDPDLAGGAQNDAALNSSLHPELVSKINVQGHEYLMYKALPIHVAIIRATTSDSQGNLSMEQESLLCDQKIIAAATRNSGGIVLAQVKRICAVGSLPARSVAVPGPLVDCVVVADEEEHPMSYETFYDPVLTGEIRSPKDELSKMPLNVRKIVARRASFGLKPGKVVNLGVGLPEGVASVAAEESMLDFVTLTIEAGVFGGLPVSGRNFGPAANADALVEMNEMFDFYDGGGLDICFLGAAQISREGDVNVSRMSKNRLTGPGGFIDISQSTNSVCFMCTFTTKGIEVNIQNEKLAIENEGQVKKFVPEVMEKTFSGNEAVRRGQKVFYITERAVFRRTAEHDVIELVEIAPGVDLQKDVLDQMEFQPVVSPDLKLMDRRVFCEKKMGMMTDMFGSLQDRISYHPEEHSLFLDLFGISINTEEDISWLVDNLGKILQPLVKESGPVDMIINYDGFDIRAGLEDQYSEAVAEFQKKYYRSVKRYTGKAFRRAKLGNVLGMMKWDPNSAFDQFDTNNDGVVSMEQFRAGMRKHFGIHIKPEDTPLIDSPIIDTKAFTKAVLSCLKLSGKVAHSEDKILDTPSKGKD